MTETFDDLLSENGENMSEFEARSGIPRFTVYRIRKGWVVARIDTVAALAKALRLPRARVAAAIEASRTAALRHADGVVRKVCRQ